jgi:hypothetical protein
MLEPSVELLIELQANSDALWNPLRRSPGDNALACAVHERQLQYRESGLALRGGGSAKGRQQHSRRLAEARKAGLLTTKGRTHPTVKLTDLAENALSSLTARYRLTEVWPLLELVAAITEAGCTNLGFVSETDIIGAADYDDVTSAELATLENQALPLLSRGWLASNSDVQGRVGYAITATGRKALAKGCPAEGALPDFDEEAADLYESLFLAALAERPSWRPEHTNNVVIPLSCGLWPERFVAGGSSVGKTSARTNNAGSDRDSLRPEAQTGPCDNGEAPDVY